MRIAITLLVLGLAAGSATASPVRLSRPVDELRLVFLDADERAPVRQGAHDDATIDVGRVVAARCPSRGCVRTVVRRQFRLRIDGVATTARAARTYAFVQNDMPGHRVRIDGRLLTSGPQLIDATTPLGVAIAHTLEIEVPISEPDGMLNESIIWLAEDVR
jgi:hypothetical protein